MSQDDLRIALIRACNIIAEQHHTNGGYYIGGLEHMLARAAWYASSALDDSLALDARVCNARLAAELHAGATQRDNSAATDTAETVANAIAYATSLICDRIRELELLAARKGLRLVK